MTSKLFAEHFVTLPAPMWRGETGSPSLANVNSLFAQMALDLPDREPAEVKQ